MTPFVIANVVLMSVLVVVIVGMLAAAIHTSRPQAKARRIVQRAPRQRPARARVPLLRRPERVAESDI
jgi:hypothetical protein